MENPTVDQVLASFLTASSSGKQAATIARYQRIDAQLRRYLEAAGHRALEDEGVQLLAMERSFQLQGACARIMRAEDLVYALAAFLYDPWLLPEPGDRRTQISQTARLAQWVCSRGLVDSAENACAMIDFRIAADNARNNYIRDPRIPQTWKGGNEDADWTDA